MSVVRSSDTQFTYGLITLRKPVLSVALVIMVASHAMANESQVNESQVNESQVMSLIDTWTSAISNDRDELLEDMLDQHIDDKGNPQQLLKQVAPNGKSALMVASKRGDMGLVKRLVQLGANVNELTLTGGSPLMFAVLGNHLEIAHWLVEAGADINARGSNGWSAATIAGAKGQAEMLRWLIQSRANMDALDVYRFTPLMRAVDNQHEESVEILLAQGGVGVHFKDESDNTALHFAVANKQQSVIRLLLNHGADPLQANRDGITPIDLAKQFPTLSGVFTHKDDGG